jgi:hypothetical protein
MKRPTNLPWREVVLVNGILSALLGLAGYLLVRRFGPEADAWVRGHAPERVQDMAELVVLVYLAYAVSLILIGMLAFFGPAWLPTRARQTPPGQGGAGAPQREGEDPAGQFPG